MASIFYHKLRNEKSICFHQDKKRLDQCGKSHQIAHKVSFQELQA
jgi:hypothetical protein